MEDVLWTQADTSRTLYLPVPDIANLDHKETVHMDLLESGDVLLRVLNMKTRINYDHNYVTYH